MTIRKVPLVTGETYHVFNRSIARQPIFLSTYDYQRALDVLIFYSYFNPPLRFSHYKRLSKSQENDFMKSLRKNNEKQVEILAFCLMPNHFHFLLKEIRERGISTFMSNFQNSYAKYFNLRKDRNGSLFQTMFKAVRIETDEQLIHVARYIHLNPITAYILKDIKGLTTYPWSSFPIYVGKPIADIVNTKTLLGYFYSKDKFITFTKDQISYQRELNKIKHLVLE
ncbi:transposase [Candidatus Daviesbacteria bacterium]|nr:transposase [Candidatus Daviesbacteria bacterium]